MTEPLSIEQKEKIKQKVSGFSPKNDRMAWKRRHDAMQELIAKLSVVEDKILEIIKEEKLPLMDQVTELRKKMLKGCIHPKEYLIVSDDGVVTCKFCNSRLRCKHD